MGQCGNPPVLPQKSPILGLQAVPALRQDVLEDPCEPIRGPRGAEGRENGVKNGENKAKMGKKG